MSLMESRFKPVMSRLSPSFSKRHWFKRRGTEVGVGESGGLWVYVHMHEHERVFVQYKPIVPCVFLY